MTVKWWNSDTKVGRAALCWELDFDAETVVKLGHRFSSRCRTEKSRGRTFLPQSEKCQSTFLSWCFVLPEERRFCWKNLGSSFCPAVKSTVEDENGGTRWRSWLRHCATNRRVAGSVPDGAIGLFHWHNPSGRTMALGLTQPLTEMRTRNISWGIKAAGA
jgi:hypothetical protein